MPLTPQGTAILTHWSPLTRRSGLRLLVPPTQYPPILARPDVPTEAGRHAVNPHARHRLFASILMIHDHRSFSRFERLPREIKAKRGQAKEEQRKCYRSMRWFTHRDGRKLETLLELLWPKVVICNENSQLSVHRVCISNKNMNR